MSARYILSKILGSLATLFFVICFNFFLFRIASSDPVATLFRGRNLTDSQRDELTHQFGLDKSTWGQFVDYLEQTAQLNLGRSYQTNQPVWDEILDEPFEPPAGKPLPRNLAAGLLSMQAADQR